MTQKLKELYQQTVLNKSAETIRSLVDERHNQKMTQQEIFKGGITIVR